MRFCWRVGSIANALRCRFCPNTMKKNVSRITANTAAIIRGVAVSERGRSAASYSTTSTRSPPSAARAMSAAASLASFTGRVTSCKRGAILRISRGTCRAHSAAGSTSWLASRVVPAMPANSTSSAAAALGR